MSDFFFHQFSSSSSLIEKCFIVNIINYAKYYNLLIINVDFKDQIY